MPPESFQRTLLVGLGQVGAKTAEHLLAEVTRCLGEIKVIQAIAVLCEETPLERIKGSLTVPPATPFESWQADFEKTVAQTVLDISQLSHLAVLTRQGFALSRTDELNVIVIANPLESGTLTGLAPLAESLRQTIYRTLGCYAGLTGLFLGLPPGESAAEAKSLMDISLPLESFDRGCFLAGLVNEAGLIIGDGEDLIERAAYFLKLLGYESDLAGDTLSLAAGWEMPLTSFGLAWLNWPGPALAEGLSIRWSQELLQKLLLAPPALDLVKQARQAAQQWLIAEKLAPPLLLDELAGLMPPVPHTLTALIPDPPWPWLLLEVIPHLEQATGQWQEAWLDRRNLLQDKLVNLRQGWGDAALTWLRQHLGQIRSGAVPTAQSYLAAVTELLQAFVAGVEEKLSEAERDLAEIDGKIGELAGSVSDRITTLPASPLATVWLWGLSPGHWWSAWMDCRQAQSMARNLAHLNRSRLLSWQIVSYYEEILPFYRHLLADWAKIVSLWEQTCRQVAEASRSLNELDWTDHLKTSLTAATGPWDEATVLELYREAVDRNREEIWEQLESFGDWVLEALEAEEICQRLRDRTRQMLLPLVALPVDEALCRQFPDEKQQAHWLAGLAEQARPFWRYDEAALAETARAQTRLDTWLLLPNGDTSPLAAAAATWPRPPIIRASRSPDKLVIVTMRQINQPILESGD